MFNKQFYRFPRQVCQGYINIKDSKIVVCVCCRDVHKTIRDLCYTFTLLSKICTLKVLFYENDSVDDTVAILNDWCKNNKIGSVISETLHIPKFGSIRNRNRIEHMSYIRNKLFDIVKSEYSSYDYMICVEADLQPLLIDNIVHALSINIEWDVMSANGIVSAGQPIYYDCWALIKLGDKMHNTNKKNNIRYPIYSGARRVHCAFGGLAFYKMCPELLKCKYHIVDYSNGLHSVEHTGLHVDMYENGLDKHYIDTSMVIVHKDSR